MPTIHIAGPLGAPLEISDNFGADYASVDLIGRIVRITHAANDEIVFELLSEGATVKLPILLGGQS